MYNNIRPLHFKLHLCTNCGCPSRLTLTTCRYIIYILIDANSSVKGTTRLSDLDLKG